MGNLSHAGILEVIMDWPEGKNFGMTPAEDVSRAKEAHTVNYKEMKFALFTDRSCCIVGKHQRWKAAVWSPTQRVAEATEGKGESRQFAEVKAVQLALDVAEQCFIFILMYGWQQIPHRGGYSSGNKTTGNGRVYLFGLLNCGKTLLPEQKIRL